VILREGLAPVPRRAGALAIAALASPPDVRPVIEERERLSSALRAIDLPPLLSHANFLFVPYDDGRELASRLLRQGLVVRAYDDGIRITIRDRVDDDLLVEAIARVLARPTPVASSSGRRVRHLRATAETRIAVRLGLDGASRVSVQTGSGIYDHFLEQLAFHAGLDLVVEGTGDLETGDHHTVEDTALLAFGEALDRSPATGAGSRGTATLPRRWTTRSPGPPSISAGGRRGGPDRSGAGNGRALFGSLAQAGRLAVHVEASGRDGITRPRRRTRRSDAR
jgi:hypothetical protein